MNKTSFSWLAIVVALGCGGGAANEQASSTPAQHHAEASDAEPTRVLDDGSRLFGSELAADREVTPLAAILAEPARFAGQTVRTEGEVAQVCQAMGCWMELRADANSPGVRVPMAGHSFFLPRDIAGKRAVIEGTVAVAELDPERREHLEAEGAQATGALSIEASGVLVQP